MAILLISRASVSAFFCNSYAALARNWPAELESSAASLLVMRSQVAVTDAGIALGTVKAHTNHIELAVADTAFGH